ATGLHFRHTDNVIQWLNAMAEKGLPKGVPEGTLAALQNPNAMLVHLDPDSAQKYHDTLYRAKGEKVASSRKRVRTWVIIFEMIAWS
ncbi:hypothetical protein GOODEAATRI_017296, partial [Goodea atripinnis]